MWGRQRTRPWENSSFEPSNSFFDNTVSLLPILVEEQISMENHVVFAP